jgi:hypothetical protein
MINLYKSLKTYLGGKKCFLVIVFLLVFTACSTSNSSPATSLLPKAVPSVKDFREMYVAKGDNLAGYKDDELSKAATATQVVQRFGNPTKSEDTSLYFGKMRMKILYFDAKDEFGNSCFARLIFFYNCGGPGTSNLDCCRLVVIETAAKQ